MQCIFNDKTEIILSIQKTIVYYIDKKGKKDLYSLVNAFKSSNTELTKRLTYIKKMLEFLIEKHKEKIQKLQKEILNKENNLFENKLKQLKSYESSNILEGDKMIMIEFVSVDQTVNYRSVMCKNTDIFSKIENIILEEYKELKNKNYYFLAKILLIRINL